MTAAPLDKLREYLLDKTIEFAWANTTFYESHWGADAPPAVAGLEDLRRLPLLDKDTAIANQMELRTAVEVFPEPVLSSGTTRRADETLEMLRAPAELDAEEEYWALRPAPEDPAAPGGAATLVIGNTHHGLGHDRSTASLIQLPFVGHDNHLHHIVHVLEQKREGAFVVDELSVSVRKLKALTAWMVGQGLRPADYGVRTIRTNSDFLLPATARRLSSAWNASLEETYSLSEFRAGAYGCPDCGRLHFDGLPIIPEVVDSAGAVLDEGVGELVLTGLYPYMQAMPLVRYRTGDVVDVVRGCPSGERGFVVWGRQQHCLYDGPTPLVGPRVLYAALDEESLVQRTPHEWEQHGLCPPGSVGRPRFAWSLDQGGVVIELPLVLPPALYVDEARAIADRVRGQIETALPEGVSAVVEWVVPEARVEAAPLLRATKP